MGSIQAFLWLWVCLMTTLIQFTAWSFPVPDSGPIHAVDDARIPLHETWLCAGQSNMVMPVRYATDGEADLFSEPFDIRLYTEGKWVKVDASNVDSLPAVPIFFALSRYRATGKPIDIIVAAVGGTGIEAWLPSEVIPETDIGRKMRKLSDDPEVIEAARLDHAEKKLPPYDQRRLAKWGLSRAYPTELYQKKVLPLKGIPITGIIWYQGESNAGSAEMAAEYDLWLNGLLSSWRQLFGEVPFWIVELPKYNYNSPTEKMITSPNDLRAAQRRCAAAGSGVYVIPAYDLGDDHDIHPKQKRAMGERIAEFVGKIKGN